MEPCRDRPHRVRRLARTAPQDLPEKPAPEPKSGKRARQRAERAVAAWFRSPESQEELGSAAQRPTAGPAARQWQFPADGDTATPSEIPSPLYRDRELQPYASASRPTNRTNAAIIRRNMSGKVLPNIREDLAIDEPEGLNPLASARNSKGAGQVGVWAAFKATQTWYRALGASELSASSHICACGIFSRSTDSRVVWG